MLIPLGLTAAASAADTEPHKRILGSGHHHHSFSPSHNDNDNKILTISNYEMQDFIKIVKSLEGWGLLFKGVSKTIEIEATEKPEGFFSMLLGTLGAILLGSILAGKGINRAGEETVRAGYRNKKVKENKLDFYCRLNL